MRIEAVPVLPAEWREPAWRFYRETFDGLRLLAVQRHLLHRDEFDEQMADRRFGKWIAVDDDGAVAGLAAMTSDLPALPLLSQDYFRHRWPRLYAEQRIFYVTFIGARRGSGAYPMLVDDMTGPIAAAGGLGMIDVCSHNETEADVPGGLARTLRKLGRPARTQRLDSQSYWLYEFPAGT
jgi:hypothetical protein